jgi:hypothetical protein
MPTFDAAAPQPITAAEPSHAAKRMAAKHAPLAPDQVNKLVKSRSLLVNDSIELGDHVIGKRVTQTLPMFNLGNANATIDVRIATAPGFDLEAPPTLLQPSSEGFQNITLGFHGGCRYDQRDRGRGRRGRRKGKRHSKNRKHPALGSIRRAPKHPGPGQRRADLDTRRDAGRRLEGRERQAELARQDSAAVGTIDVARAKGRR